MSTGFPVDPAPGNLGFPPFVPPGDPRDGAHAMPAGLGALQPQFADSANSSGADIAAINPSSRQVPPASATSSDQLPTAERDASGSAVFDPQLLQETKLQIRAIVNEIARLSRSDTPIEQFWDEFLSRVVSALAAVAGAVWIADDTGRVRLKYQINLSETQVLSDDRRRTPHSLLVKQTFRDAHASLVPPRSGSWAEDEAGNPTDYLVVLAPLPLEDRVHAVVEIFQRPGGGPTTQRGYLRFVVQMCELAIDFLKNHRLRSYGDRQALWNQLEQFVLSIHRGRDLKATSYTLVNDGRTLVECDRLSLALIHNGQPTIEAVSGLDALDRRSPELAALGRLVEQTTKLGEATWMSHAAEDLPPQLDEPLREYVELSHSKLVGVVPLFFEHARSPIDASDCEQTGCDDTLVGALVVEQFRDTRPSHTMLSRTDVLAEHASVAIANQLDRRSLWLSRWWQRATGSTDRSVSISARFTAQVAVVALLIGVWWAMWLVPAQLEIPAAGQLQPSSRRDVFATVDGIIVEAPIRHGEHVAAGQVLARLRNTDIELEVSRLTGQRISLEQRLEANAARRLRGLNLAASERDRLAAEATELQQELTNVKQRLQISRERQQRLTVVADQAGEVVTWQADSKLLRRPVREGDVLLTLVDSRQPWQLELEATERCAGHIADALRAQPDGLPVRFRLSTHPDRDFPGRLVEVQQQTEAAGANQSPCVRLRVTLDSQALPELHAGTSVQAKVQCGRCSLGYAWFHDAIDALRANVLFWLS